MAGMRRLSIVGDGNFDLFANNDDSQRAYSGISMRERPDGSQVNDGESPTIHDGPYFGEMKDDEEDDPIMKLL
jgi:hypothetical protein